MPHDTIVQNPFENKQSFASLREHAEILAEQQPSWLLIVNKLNALEGKFDDRALEGFTGNIAHSLAILFQRRMGIRSANSDLQNALDKIKISPLSKDVFQRAGIVSGLAALFYLPCVGIVLYAMKEHAALEKVSKAMGGGFSLPLIIGIVSFVGAVLTLVALAVVVSALYEYFDHRSKTMALDELKETIGTLANQMNTMAAYEKVEVKQVEGSPTNTHLGSLLSNANDSRQVELQNIVAGTGNFTGAFQAAREKNIVEVQAAAATARNSF